MAVKNMRGFSLVEILITLAIIAVLASLVLPALQRAREGARARHCTSNLRQIGMSLQSYAEDWDNAYPEEFLADAIYYTHTSKDILKCPSDKATSPSEYKDQAIDNPLEKMTSYVWAGPLLNRHDFGRLGIHQNDYLNYMQNKFPWAGLVACMHHGYYTELKSRHVLRLAFDGSVKMIIVSPKKASVVWRIEDSLGWKSLDSLIKQKG